MARRLISGSRDEDRQAQLALMAKIEERFTPMFAADIARTMRKMATDIETEGDIFGADAYQTRIEALSDRQAAIAVRVFGSRILTGKQYALAPDMTHGLKETLQGIIAKYIGDEKYRQRIRRIDETTREMIVNAVQKGRDEGLGQDAIARRIREAVPAIARSRSGVIARTETHSAANFGGLESAKTTGLDIRKEWLASDGERTRFSHAAVDGQIRAENQPFNFPASDDGGSYSLMYPGDPNGPAHGVINCRCTLAYLAED